MKKWLIRLVATGTLAAGIAATVALAVTPVSGGDAGGSLVAVNNGPGDQTEPHVSGDLAVYTNNDGTAQTIHYFDFLTDLDRVVPTGAPGDNDVLPDVGGDRIAFSRLRAADNQTAVMLFDRATGVVTELDPQPVMARFGAVVGGDTVAYSEYAGGGNGEIYAYDVAAGTSTNMSNSPAVDGNPNIAPAGDVVVWERCVGSNCDVYQSLRTGAAWGSPTPVAATSSNDANPDTDGTTVVYDSDRPSATGPDIYLKPVSGGPEVPVQLAGFERNPGVSNGVVSFESSSTLGGNADIWVYVIATNTLFRVTDTPTVNESLNDVSVLPNGEVRVVWAADDDLVLGNHNARGRTFSLPATGVFTAAVQQPINVDGSSVFKAGKGVVPVKFSLAVDGSPTCTLPAATIALTRLSGAVTGAVNESEFVMPADSGSSFRIDSCQYVYNLSLKSLSAATYRVEIKINGQTVGSATFELR